MAATLTDDRQATFSWQAFTQIPVKPYVAAAEIRRLYAEQGRIEAGDLVDASASADAPLHECFEWDDGAAARQHRESQARYILRSLVVVYRDDAGQKTSPVRYIVSLSESGEDENPDLVRPNQERRYIPVNVVLSDEVLRRRQLKQAMAEAKAWRNRYEHIRDLAAIFAAIDEVELREAG